MRSEVIGLQRAMSAHEIDLYIVPTADEHQSEYIPEFYAFRAYLSGFTGSAGTLLVTKEECCLWTDGRYFIQAEKQLEGSGIILMRSGEKDVPTLESYIIEHAKTGEKIGVDFSKISCEFGKRLQNIANQTDTRFVDIDLSSEVWLDRPAILISKIKRLGLFLTGRRVQEKLEMIREEMKAAGADTHVISSLDDIAWLFNLRGKDIPYNPVFYSYAVITDSIAGLFIKGGMETSLIEILQDEKVQVHDYFSFFPYLEEELSGKRVLLDSAKTSYRTYSLLKEDNQIINGENPSSMIKTIKTAVETANIKEAHEQDGLVMTKFIHWIKKQVKEDCRISEYDAARYLDELRLKQMDCVDLSFDTIAAYQENAAMCHYSPSEQNTVYLKNEGFLLVDSGGQYQKGTTDVTRTIALGELTKKQKEHYTLVLQGHIRLAMARFPEGVCGANLDILARGPLWNKGLDYNHGTGHGVGCYLNVHEGPVSIHWNLQRAAAKKIPLKKGMLLSNEPGIYLAEQYGIRIENLILVKETEAFGMRGFLEFETLTSVPYEKDAILPELLTEDELDWLNEYHRHIFERYAKKMTDEERNWLRYVTEPLSKSEKECYNQSITEDAE